MREITLNQHSESWQLSPSAAEIYERNLVPVLFKHWASDLTKRVALKPGMRILDAACGTGIVARLAAQQVGDLGQVTGVDLSKDMLTVAHRQALATGLNIHWLNSDVVRLALASASFDVVFCQQSLQFFQNKLCALKELHRVLKPEGTIALNLAKSLSHNPYIDALATALEHHLGAEAGETMRAPCSFGSKEALCDILTAAGFISPHIETAVLKISHSEPATFISRQLAATPVASAIATLDKHTHDALIKTVLTLLQPYISASGLTVPYKTLVASARTGAR